MQWELRDGVEDTLYERIKHMVLRIDGNDYMSLPPTITNTIRVRLPPKVMQTYKQFEADFLFKLENGGVLAANNAAVLSGKCRQIANGQAYDEHHNWHAVHDEKLDALGELLDELGEQPLLLFYQFVSDAERIKARFPFAVSLDEKDALDRFKAGKVRLLIAHPASGGHGLNMHQGGAKNTAYYGLPWSLDLYIQSAGRLNGARAKTTSYIHHIVAVGTIEERISRVLADKARTQTDLLNAVKRAA